MLKSHTAKTKKLIIAANRLPVIVSRKNEKDYKYITSPGGLVAALSALKSKYESTWLGWPGIMDPELFDCEKVSQDLRKNYGAEPIFLNRRQINRYYFSYSNRVLWPVLHYLPDYTLYEERSYLAYKEVNQIFADRIISLLEKKHSGNEMIWIQDYQLMLLPAMLRARLPDACIGFFLHTPFPSSEMFRTLPYREELLQGLLGASLIGFHTFNYQRHFSSSVLHILGIEAEFSRIKLDTHTLHMGTFPIGVDTEKIRKTVESPGLNGETMKVMVQNIIKGRRMILCVDRLDYTKGIPDRLRAYRKFLHRNPERVNQVILIQIAVPSRTEIKDYQSLKYEVEEIISQIEEDFEHKELAPIRFLYRSFSFEHLACFYQAADVALVTPYFDGMNLVAKEYVAIKKDKGVLILSERAGAAYELGEALLINPWNSDQISLAIEEALNMSIEEQTRRMSSMYDKVLANDIHYWSNSFLKSLADHTEEESESVTLFLSDKIQTEIIPAFQKASRRILLLDYDGTLREITNLPMNAEPDKELLSLLENLSALPNTDIAIVTGRKTDEIINWLGHLNVIFSTEHGLRIKLPHEELWHYNASTGTVHSWYGEVREVLEQYNRATPGSFMEAKEASLTWHYRMVDPILGKWKANELKINLQNALANHPLEVVSGKMVVEVRPQGIHKGNIFPYLQQKGYQYDFLMAIGDDATDEYMFNAMPLSCIGIKVGKVQTRAQYRLHTVAEVRSLLWKLLKK